MIGFYNRDKVVYGVVRAEGLCIIQVNLGLKYGHEDLRGLNTKTGLMAEQDSHNVTLTRHL
jgi:hypothetical protein